MVPDPRPDIVEYLKELYLTYIEQGAANEAFESRWRWSTADERCEALASAKVSATTMFALYWAEADRQDTELAVRLGQVPADAVWLDEIGVAAVDS